MNEHPLIDMGNSLMSGHLIPLYNLAIVLVLNGHAFVSS
jgi:hypothetical protein